MRFTGEDETCDEVRQKHQRRYFYTAHGWKRSSNSGILHQQKFSVHLIIGSRDDDRRGDFCPFCPGFVSIGEDSISSGKIRLRRVLSFCPIYKK